MRIKLTTIDPTYTIEEILKIAKRNYYTQLMIRKYGLKFELWAGNGKTKWLLLGEAIVDNPMFDPIPMNIDLIKSLYEAYHEEQRIRNSFTSRRSPSEQRRIRRG